ncbi:hypothetical protein MTO96_013385 [Rhipicephalus appendiculatus]
MRLGPDVSSSSKYNISEHPSWHSLQTSNRCGLQAVVCTGHHILAKSRRGKGCRRTFSFKSTAPVSYYGDQEQETRSRPVIPAVKTGQLKFSYNGSLDQIFLNS